MSATDNKRDAATHAIQRTSPKGQAFVGTCVLCGAIGLTAADALKPCPAGKSHSEGLLTVLEGPSK